MKIALTGLGFIALAFLATGLLEFGFFTECPERRILVGLLTLLILVCGFWVVRTMAQNKKE